jgi:hypothetical protein
MAEPKRIPIRDKNGKIIGWRGEGAGPSESFRGPVKGGKRSKGGFVAPKQKPGESLGDYARRVREARAAWEKIRGQRDGLKRKKK